VKLRVPKVGLALFLLVLAFFFCVWLFVWE